MHGLVPVDCPYGSFCRSEPKTRCGAFLDGSVVLLDHVVEVGRRPAATAAPQFPRLFQFPDGAGVQNPYVRDSRIRLPPRISSIEAISGIRMQNAGNWNPAIHQPSESSEWNAAALAAT
jgi:hypothetical protein